MAVKNYLDFIFRERRILVFGASLTFFSSFGQTFLFSLFVPFFLDEFSLTNGTFGSLYSLATLSSAALLPVAGQWIDRIPVKHYSTAVALILALASLIMANSWGLATLFLAIFLLRLAGQGLSGHTADTTMAKVYDRERGKALSISSLGYPIAEGIMPLMVAALTTFMYWRNLWLLFAFTLALFVAPAYFRLIRKHPVNEEAARRGEQERQERKAQGRRWVNPFEYLAYLKDRRMIYVLPAALVPPFWVTGFFLYQVSFGPEYGWKATTIATAFIGFAIARVIAAIAIGPLIDRFSARQIFPFYLLPLMISFLIPVVVPGAWTVYPYLFLMGVLMGMANPLKSALWAEMYGVDNIGQVRSVFASLMVFGTALSPFIMGFLLDTRFSVDLIFGMAVVTCVLAMILSFQTMKHGFCQSDYETS